MDNLTPITREEILMNDEPLTPITREEKILAGEDLNPVTRREYFLKKYRHAGGDVMVEGLSVTENGTYTAPEGKAYSPVEVNVPMPENAYLLKTASGSLVSFADGADLPMPSFVCKIDAVQSGSGEPSPENIRPISGHTGVNAFVRGKNLLPMTVDRIKAANTSGTWSGNTYTLNGVTFTILTDSDGNITSITASGTASGGAAYLVLDSNFNSDALAGCIVNGLPQSGGARYRVSSQYDFVGIQDIYNSSTVVANGTSLRFSIRIESESTANNLTFKPMIRLATETVTTYEPYNPNSQTIQVSWQTEAGEVYGGYIDLVSGVLTVTDGYIDLGTCEWLRTDLGNNNYRYYTTEVSSLVKAPSSTSEMPNIECSHYKNKLPSQYNQAVDGITIYTNGSIQVYDSTRSALTTTDFKTAMDGVQLVYELATPITYQLTPTQIKSLLDNNNAWCSTGDVNVDYFAKEV